MVRPKSNLPPEAQPWARSVEDDLTAIQQSLDSGVNAILNNNKAVNSTLGRISDQISSISNLQAQQAITNAAVAAQLAAINSLIGDQIASTNYSNVANGITLATTDIDFAAGTVTVPSGYTRAQILLVTAASVYNSRASVDFMYLSAVINGVKSREIPTQVNSTTNADVTTSSSASLTGLTPGGTISLGARAHAQGGAWAFDSTGRIAVEAIVIFLR